jgi:hypothetical protein
MHIALSIVLQLSTQMRSKRRTSGDTSNVPVAKPILSYASHGTIPIQLRKHQSRCYLTVTSPSWTISTCTTDYPRVRSGTIVEPHIPRKTTNTCFASRHVETSNFAQRDYDKPNTLNGHSVCQKGHRHVIAVEQFGQRLFGLSRNHSVC